MIYSNNTYFSILDFPYDASSGMVVTEIKVKTKMSIIVTFILLFLLIIFVVPV